MDLEIVWAGAYTLAFFDDGSRGMVPFVLAVQHEGNLALERPLDTARPLRLVIRSEYGATTVELVDPDPTKGQTPAPSEIRFSVHGASSNLPVKFALSQGAVFTIGLATKSEMPDVHQLPVDVFRHDLLPRDNTREAVDQSNNAISAWWDDILQKELGSKRQTANANDREECNATPDPKTEVQGDSCSVSRIGSSEVVHEKVIAAKLKFIESGGVHQTHPRIDLRGPFVVDTRGYCLVFPATFASDLEWLPEGVPFFVAVKCPMKHRIVSTVTQVATNSPLMIQMSGWVALEGYGRIDLDYTVRDQRESYNADGTALQGDNIETMSFLLDRDPWIDFNLAKGRVFLATIDSGGSARVKQLEHVTIPKSVLGADDARRSENGIAGVVHIWSKVNCDK
jgi:hypothetical protein